MEKEIYNRNAGSREESELLKKVMIRKATIQDISRIAEILVFVRRMFFRPIFQNDRFSFGELQVLPLAEEYSKPEILGKIWVYDDGIVKGLIRIDGSEVVELYVDYFFQNEGIGSKLIEFAKAEHGVEFLWSIEKNTAANRFYENHGFRRSDERKYEEGTTEFNVKMVREMDH